MNLTNLTVSAVRALEDAPVLGPGAMGGKCRGGTEQIVLASFFITYINISYLYIVDILISIAIPLFWGSNSFESAGSCRRKPVRFVRFVRYGPGIGL
jgi:hypothetical protein